MAGKSKRKTRTQRASDVSRALRAKGNARKAVFLQRFFKTGPGQYAEGDKLLGVTVPQTRIVVHQFAALPVSQALLLLASPFHENRLAALLILVEQFRKGDAKAKRKIYEAYLKNTKRINNWDLVDSSAPQIVGEYLVDRPRTILDKLAGSKLLWDRRIAILATYAFIKRNDFKDVTRIAKKLLRDKEDLMYKAVGWMLREMGKRDVRALYRFLNQHAHEMPRTTLRYAVEKVPSQIKKRYMRQAAPRKS